jgi:simple sugar transport system permease protein
VFIALLGKNPIEVYELIYRGGFASGFAWQNTLARAAPLMLTALCVALPAQAGLIVIGAEGALVLGGLAAAVTGHALLGGSPLVAQLAMALAAMIVGGAWIALAGALRHYRGVNETISSLLLTYIAIALFKHFVEGPLRDPASLNKPSTPSIDEASMVGHLPGMDVHWGLVYGLVFCVGAYFLVRYTVFGFALRIVGGNVRAARLAGLAVGPLILLSCFLGGAAAGLAGMAEVAAVHGSANASLIAGYGYAGIMV